jgi:hypothetical protein
VLGAIVIFACGVAGYLAQSGQSRMRPMPAMQAPDQSLAMPEPVARRPASSLAAESAPIASVTPVVSAVDVVRSDRRYQSLLAGPAKFIASKTMLGNGKALQVFLADPKRVDRYLDHPVIHGALTSPSIVKTMLTAPVIEAFLTSAAMKDPKVVRALAGSKLVKEIANAPGVQQALADPAIVQRLMLNPNTGSWLGRNPDAMKALVQFGPAFAAAHYPKLKKAGVP